MIVGVRIKYGEVGINRREKGCWGDGDIIVAGSQYKRADKTAMEKTRGDQRGWKW